jgi:1,4-alpha-glucan branching enzyme
MHLIQADPWLEPYHQALRVRQGRFHSRLNDIKDHHRSIFDWANGHLFFGFHRGYGPYNPQNPKDLMAPSSPEVIGTWYREWAPRAQSLSLIGDFNQWNPTTHPLRQRLSPQGTPDGVWEIFIPDHAEAYEGLTHGQKIKVQVCSSRGIEDRIPLYIRRVVQDPVTLDFAGQIWNPPEIFQWSDCRFRECAPEPILSREHGQNLNALRIYEAHVGMSSEKPEMADFSFFENHVLPRIAKGGYNALQLMAIMEHPYYGSFGYHVANFFAVSSRFGTPEQLKSLIDKAHQMGLLVFLDIVHSHAASNTREGLFGFDGSEDQFFHQGEKGHHQAWDSKLFNYGKPEVQHFLLSNIKFWLEEYRFDGFRFDGVTSMLYQHHGYGVSFNHYDRYFNEGEVDHDAVLYLQLANTLIKEVNPQAISVAEDVSGMPGLASPIEDGGLGFDYRLAMGLPDFWIRFVTEVRDEDWSCAEIFRTLTNRRSQEKHIAYVESHDQSLVGDKTLIFRMADALMYDHMDRNRPHHLIDRALALSKIIRLLTATCGGEGYLNFMGNEFGHPEWVDFPREGNGWSYHYARRQWSLADRSEGLYQELLDFDRDLQLLLKNFPVLIRHEPYPQISLPELIAVHEDDKILVCARGAFLIAANLHISKDCRDFVINHWNLKTLWSRFSQGSPLENTGDPENPRSEWQRDTDSRPSIVLTTGKKSLENSQISCDFSCRFKSNKLEINLPHRSAMVINMT